VSGQLEFGEEDTAIVLRRAWDLSLHLLASKVPTVTFETYIRPIQPLAYEGQVVTLGVGNAFARDWIEKKALNPLRSALEFHLDVSGLTIQLVVLTRDQQFPVSLKKPAHSKSAAGQIELLFDDTGDLDDIPNLPAPRPLNPLPESAPAPESPPITAPSATTRRGSKSLRGASEKNASPADDLPSLALNDRFVFDHFFVGKSNRLAFAGAKQVAERPGEAYNPLFLYGAPGLGKTHLLQGIAHEIKRTRPNARIAYVSGEAFAQQYITSLKQHATEDFRRQYRQIDVWLVDDIQFIASKEHTKEEFFHTFNTLYQMGKQIVIASDRSPRELNTMDERLRTRFQSGLIADIGAPELETRIAILQRYCERSQYDVPLDILEYIASAIQSNIRTLEGAVTKLLAYSSLLNMPVSMDAAHEALKEYCINKPPRTKALTVEDIIETVAAQFGTTANIIKGSSRNKEVSLARHVAIYLCRELLPEVNLRIIGGALGGRDHTTILHAYQKMQDMIGVDSDLTTLLKTLSARLSV
jgi:chromosomal replication initiator protein